MRAFSFLKINLFIFNWRELLYTIVLVSAMHQHESAVSICMSPSSWASLPPHPTLTDCHTAPGLSSLWQIPTGYLFYIWWCVCFKVTLSIHPFLSIPHCARKPASTAALRIRSSAPPRVLFLSASIKDSKIFQKDEIVKYYFSEK